MGFVAYATPELEARSQYPTIIAICVSLSACSILVVSMRLAIRTSKSALRLDDVMAFLAMILGTAYSVLCIVQARYGLGLPPPLRPKQSMDTYAKVNYAGRPVYQVGISLFKIALLISYLHLLQVTSMKTYRIFVWVAIAFVSLSHLGSALSLIFACNPVQKSWKPLLPGTCLPDGASFTAYATLTIISDVLVTIIPLPVLMQVKVPRSKKFGLVGVFMLGLFTTVCSILRYTQINRVQFGDHDSTMLVLWGVIEFNTGNIVSSLPFLTPVFLRKAKDYRSKRSNGYHQENSANENSKSSSNQAKVAASYALSSIGKTADNFGTKTFISSSEENILKKDTHTIVKSVGYQVRHDDWSTHERSRD